MHKLFLRDGVLDVAATGAALGAAVSTWHPRFGASVPAHVLVLGFENAAITTWLQWSRAG